LKAIIYAGHVVYSPSLIISNHTFGSAIFEITGRDLLPNLIDTSKTLHILTILKFAIFPIIIQIIAKFFICTLVQASMLNTKVDMNMKKKSTKKKNKKNNQVFLYY